MDPLHNLLTFTEHESLTESPDVIMTVLYQPVILGALPPLFRGMHPEWVCPITSTCNWLPSLVHK